MSGDQFFGDESLESTFTVDDPAAQVIDPNGPRGPGKQPTTAAPGSSAPQSTNGALMGPDGTCGGCEARKRLIGRFARMVLGR